MDLIVTLSHDSDVDPASLRIEYRQADVPIEAQVMGLDGRYHLDVCRGLLRIEWDAPEGTFIVVFPQRGDYGREAYDEMRPLIALRVQAAYEASRGSPPG